MPETARAGRRLVPLREHHLPEMLRIFNEHVADGFAAYPQDPIGVEAMRSLLSQALKGLRVAAETTEGSLLGFGFLRPYAPQAAFAHTAQITIFLDPRSTRAGLGSAILQDLEQRARPRGIAKLLAHISSRNPPSLAFHTQRGFAECGRFPGIGRKWGEPFDVVWMIKDLEQDA